MAQRCILNEGHLDIFVHSSTYDELMSFTELLNRAAIGKECHDVLTGEVTPWISEAFRMLNEEEDRLSLYPPIQQRARFGNPAFRSWLSEVEQCATMEGLDAQGHEQELASYWCGSFGNKTRLDYGTGHEASFLVWLFAMQKIHHTTELDLENIVLCIFPRYWKLVRHVQIQYKLEPAGSHGVWSLDDYQFLPFLFGSAQLIQSADIRPSAVRDEYLVESLVESNMYMSAISQILRVKTGMFAEHSPLLMELSKQPSWEKLNKGYMLMFQGEVLGKFPVAQHFLFGELFQATWEISNEDRASQASGTAATPAIVSPFAKVRANGGGDALAKYFNVNHQHGRVGGSRPPEVTPKIEFELLDKQGIVLKGWKIESLESRIGSHDEIDAIITNTKYRSLDFPLPEMLFVHNVVRFSKGRFVFEFNALDALLGCKIVFDEKRNPDRTLLKVPAADKWINRVGSDGQPIKNWRDDYDWTFTTGYKGSLVSPDEATFVPTDKSIDYIMLMKRDPILYFANNLLYEDDLFDFGESKLYVKLRVMESCFFALSRFWMRVDGSYVRCYDTRLFHKYGEPYVLVETCHKQISAEKLREKGFTDFQVMMDEARMDSLLEELEKKTFQVNIE